MGETREGSYNFEMNGKIMRAKHDMHEAMETRHFYVSLLENPDGLPDYFLGIDGQLRRNDCAYRLALAIHSGLITYKEAIEKLRKFGNDIIESEMIEEYGEIKREMDICPSCGVVLGFKDEKFDNDIVEEGKWTKAKGKWAIKGRWEQLSLWSQSELDQI